MCIAMSKNDNENVIRAYRVSVGKTCAELALKLRVAESTLRSYENGTRVVTPARAKEWEELTEGGLTRAALLPELFADLRDEAAA
jgi:DNA-binding transcriptional regulator YdaS (Cro superfamily)